jgi:AsmA protein
MRRLAMGFGIFIVVVVAALLIFVATFDVNKYHVTIQSELEKRLGRPVTLGDMHLGVFPPRFRVQDPSIAEDPHFGDGAAFVKAQQLE